MKTFLSLILVTLFCAVAAAQLGMQDEPANETRQAPYTTYEEILARYHASEEYFGKELDGEESDTAIPVMAPDPHALPSPNNHATKTDVTQRPQKAKSIKQLPTFVRPFPNDITRVQTNLNRDNVIRDSSFRKTANSIIREPNERALPGSQQAVELNQTHQPALPQPPSTSIGLSGIEASYQQETSYPQTEHRLQPVPQLKIPHATQDPDAMVLVAPYQTIGPNQIQPSPLSIPDQPRIHSTYNPWWTQQVANPLLPGQTELQVTLNELIHEALQHSPHIQLAATQPHIRQSSVFEESAQFDWKAFVEAKYEDTNDPIGNTLTTGNNADRFQQREGYSRSGIRRRSNQGNETELIQRFGWLTNNSNFLAPQDQGNSRLELNYRHPLMKGRGIAVNESVVVLANIDFRSAGDDFAVELQRHLSDITETYWELVRARSEYLQKAKLLVSAEAILSNLEGRSAVDTIDRQTFRARAVVASRRAEIARSLTAIENAESRIRLLVNSPALNDASAMELVPIDRPSSTEFPISLTDAVSTALVNRPDVSRAIRDVKAANVRNGVAANELLPKLDLLLGTYIAGLDGDFDALNSWLNQFRDGRPGYNVGLEFEIPIGNRAAKARAQRAEWEMKRAIHQFRAVVETGKNEVEVSVREVQTARQEIMGRYYAMVAAKNETEFLIDRWETLPEVDDSATLLLEDLLDSQERLADEEAAFSRARFAYAVSVVQLKRAMGVLMQHNN